MRSRVSPRPTYSGLSGTSPNPSHPFRIGRSSSMTKPFKEQTPCSERPGLPSRKRDKDGITRGLAASTTFFAGRPLRPWPGLRESPRKRLMMIPDPAPPRQPLFFVGVRDPCRRACGRPSRRGQCGRGWTTRSRSQEARRTCRGRSPYAHASCASAAGRRRPASPP